MASPKSYVVLLRGINVGGKNKVPMAGLKRLLEEQHGFADVTTYIQSGNVVLTSALSATTVAKRIEESLPGAFKLDVDLVRVLVLTHAELRGVVENKPKGFGEEPDKYHSDAIFLMGVSAEEVMPVFSPREGVDRVWPGDGVIYSQRLSAERTKSRLSRIVASPFYQAVTIRSWNTTTRLLAMMDRAAAD